VGWFRSSCTVGVCQSWLRCAAYSNIKIAVMVARVPQFPSCPLTNRSGESQRHKMKVKLF